MTSAIHTKVIVLHGTGAVGKTQLATDVEKRYSHYFNRVFWLDGSSKPSLESSFAQIIRQQQATIDQKDSLEHSIIDDNHALQECLAWLSLEANSHWLLVIDNVNGDFHATDGSQPYDIKAYFPVMSDGTVLITSRSSVLGELGIGIEVTRENVYKARETLHNVIAFKFEGEFLSKTV